ncbi:hypothetical protein A3758_07735 [Oleiphilus sp. HI0118]|nr:hypothetical protein A3758_07735 [Oleiphilus sp. HI0118]
MKIIFGGSFDPIHIGHLRIATELSEAFSDRCVDIIPCKNPLHKSQLNVSPEARLSLIQAAVEGDARLAVNACELEREGVSDSFTTLSKLSKGGHSPIVMAIGTDSALGLDSWYKADELAELCHMVVLKRPDYSSFELEDVFRRLGFEFASTVAELEECGAGKVYLLDVTQLEISSSVIRRKIAQNLSIKYLVPDAVHQIICNNRLYY